MTLTERYPDWCPAILVVVSLTLVVILFGEAVVHVSDSGSLPDEFLMGALTNVPIYAGVGFGVANLKASTVESRHYPRVVRWSIGGGVALAVLVGIFVPVVYSAWLMQFSAIRWAFSVGIGGGFYAGYFSIRLVRQRVKAERAMVRAEEATERQELLEYLNALLRHEVLNAANVVHGRADFLTDHLEDDLDVAAHLDAVKRQSDEMAKIVTDVRVLLQANETDMEFHQVDVVSVIENEIEKVTDRHASVEIVRDLPDAAVLRANELLPRVFENLLRNAVEHNHSSPARLEITGRKTASHFHVEVRDNGPGIPEHLQSELFTPSVSRLNEDHGIGTVIVGRLVEQFGGDIEISETGPDGTTVSVTLPLATDQQQGEAGGLRQIPKQ